jgi:hypothetical protein
MDNYSLKNEASSDGIHPSGTYVVSPVLRQFCGYSCRHLRGFGRRWMGQQGASPSTKEIQKSNTYDKSMLKSMLEIVCKLFRPW